MWNKSILVITLYFFCSLSFADVSSMANEKATKLDVFKLNLKTTLKPMVLGWSDAGGNVLLYRLGNKLVVHSMSKVNDKNLEKKGLMLKCEAQIEIIELLVLGVLTMEHPEINKEDFIYRNEIINSYTVPTPQFVQCAKYGKPKFKSFYSKGMEHVDF